MTTKSRIHLSVPHMSGLEQQYINEAFTSNWIAPLGPNVDAFEQEIAEYVGTKGALALSSGTAAIHLAVKLLDLKPGDKVFCSTLTFAASANPIIYEGGEPVFIDSEPESWNMSPQALAKALEQAQSEGWLPKAAIIVDLYGQSADMDPLLELLDHYQVPMIEDAAEALGATYKGKACGSFGQFGILSFNGNKIITTSGGGMLLSDDLEALAKARFWSTQARDKARHYQHSEIGYNYRLSNVLAGIGRGQFRVLEERVEQRRKVFERYYAALKDIKGVNFMPEAPFGRCNRWLTTLTIDPNLNPVTPNDLLDALEAENIEGRPIWKPLHLQPVFQKYKYFAHGSAADSQNSPWAATNGSVADYIFNTGICLPSGSNMTTEEQDRVIDVLLKVLKK
ncbi:MAG: aminotransferase class I/II-fold pyridoxal phosphate-dependent enzyme [Peptococcaceae bacterium]|nr:aminotransferase class I/II-fold pyridoxal phosphate-dependent enzyme [Peptococcaceae bacterium]